MLKKKADAPGEATGLQLNQDALKEFEQWREMFKLRLTGEDTVNEEKVYLLEGDFNEDYLKKNPKAENVMATMKTIKIWVSQKDLYPRKLVTCGRDGRQMNLIEMESVKLNGKVDESLFNYTPPEGAQVRDMTEEGK